MKQKRFDDERELLLRLLEKEGLGPVRSGADSAAVERGSSAASVSPPRAESFPLSFPQEHLWFLQRFEPESNFYNVLAAWKISGEVDLRKLQTSLQEVVRRHEILRTRFVQSTEGDPVQRVQAGEMPLSISTNDLRDANIGEEAKEERAKQIVIEESSKPFDLEQPPLFRVVIVRLTGESSILGLCMHHIICDHWSVGVLMKEWGRLYRASSENESEGEFPPLQYGDYAQEQRLRMQGNQFQQQLQYWKEKLQGMPQTLDLPTDHARPRRPTFNGAFEGGRLSQPLLRKVNGLSQNAGASLFMTLLAAFQVLLMRYTGQEDFGVGTPLANRRRRETEKLIGFCLNTVVMRAQMVDAMSFRDVLLHTRKSVLEAFEHQDLPFEKLVQEMAPDRDVSRTPLFQAMFTTQSRGADLEFGGAHFTDLKVDLPTSKFDLLMIVAEDGRGASVEINYSTDLFEEGTIRRLLGHYKVLLESVTANPDQRIGDIVLQEQGEIDSLRQWNTTHAEYPRDRGVADLFEDQVVTTPGALAVEFDNEKLTYADLNRRANLLAHHLQNLGARTETRICVCMDRGIEMVVAMLAVLKSGAACVPLDPAYPKDRLQFMVRDCEPLAVLTQRKHSEALADVGQANISFLNTEDSAQWSSQPESNPSRPPVGPQALVYVIYTSGSTGQPKGVAMPMRAVSNLLTFQKNESPQNRPQRTLQFAALGFDVSFQEIFSTLCSGGALVLIDESKRLTPVLFARHVIETRVERLFIPVVALQMLVEGFAVLKDENKTAGLAKPALRQVIVAGEQLRIDDRIRDFFQELRECRLDNQYGPTETHLASVFHLPPDSRQWPSLPSIGLPIANAQLHLLDKNLRAVPVGVVGEIYIGGDGVARGYLNRPDLTAERFVEDAFSEEPSARMYRTGDLGKRRADGAVEYVGRNDFQVKIRGHRVELGEIEALLQQQSGVRGSVVVLRDGTGGGKRLVAYVAGDCTSESVRRELKKRLPAYMVPSVVAVFKSLPLSSNGKIDRQALPDIESFETESAGENSAAPRNATEEQLARIWIEVLQIKSIGINSNFFDLGGHSLLATLMATRIRRATGIDLPVRAIFESPTIAELAEVVELELLNKNGNANGDSRTDEPRAVKKSARPGSFPLSYPQEQLWFLDRLQPGSDIYNVALAFRLKGNVDVPILERSLNEIVRRHEILRTRFLIANDGQPRQEVAGEQILVPLRQVELAAADAHNREIEARRILTEEGGKGFDLHHAPLLRATLVQIDQSDYALGLTLHHVVCDDWSLKLLMKEWSAIYTAFKNGETSPLPDLPAQYGDYALQQRTGVTEKLLEQQLSYWKNHLSGMPAVLELPTDKPRPVHQSFRGGTEQRTLSANLRTRLNAVARSEKASLFMVLLAAYQVLLTRYSGQQDYGIGTVVANRNRAETEDSIGFFLNTLVMRANLIGEPTFREVLQRVREASLAAFAHQDIPFERLVEELAPNRDVSRTPVFQVVFTLRKAAETASDFADLRLEDFDTDLNTAKFDLIMAVEERERDSQIVINYVADLFEAESIRRMLDHFDALLEGIAANPDQPVADLPMMDERERELIASWEGTARPDGLSDDVVQSIERLAETSPDAIAMSFGKNQITYSGLNSSANQIGRYLSRAGVGPESTVGIFLPGSTQLVCAIAGTLKAGGAYSLLSTEDPADRLREIIVSASFSHLISVQALSKRLPAGANVICLDKEADIIAGESGANLDASVGPQNLAVVVPSYSGSSEQVFKMLTIDRIGLAELVQAGASVSGAANSGNQILRGLLHPKQARVSLPARVHILDDHLHRVAVGVPGQVWMRGASAGRGYAHQPDLTAERYLPDPFSTKPGARMFASGEKARYRPDGTIEQLGRMDNEIEVKGRVINIDEIESAIADYDSVEQAAVVGRPDGELAAFVVTREGRKLAQAELRSLLEKKLPSFMVPNTFVPSRQLPRKPSGALDRAALAKLTPEHASRDFVPPRTELEQSIADAWRSVLGKEKIGIHENFFDLGGHSLLAIQLHQKLRNALGLDIELLHLFQFPTIDSMVRFLHAGFDVNDHHKSLETKARAGQQKNALHKFRKTQSWTTTQH